MNYIRHLHHKVNNFHKYKEVINYRKAASRYLKNLENIDVLKSEKIGREILYLNKELMEILKY